MSKNLSFINSKELNEAIRYKEPVTTKIEFLPKGYELYINNITFVDFDDINEQNIDKSQGFLAKFTGVQVELIVIDSDKELKENQARIIYSDGNSKIINIE